MTNNITQSDQLIRKTKIKAIVKNPFDNWEKALRIIKKEALKQEKLNEILNILNQINNQETIANHELYQGDQNKNKDNTLSRIVEKEETFEEELEKNQMKIQNKELTTEDEKRLRAILKQHLVLKFFPDEIFEYVMTDLILLNVSSGKYIFEEGFEANFFYIIAKGEVDILAHGKTIKVLREWEHYNEMSLFMNYNCNRNDISLKCVSNTKIYLLDSEKFQAIQLRMIQYKLDEQFNFIDNISLLQTLGNYNKFLIAEQIEKEDYQSNTMLIEQGTISRNIYLIGEGSVLCKDKKKEVKMLTKNDYFGIDSLLFNVVSNLTYLTDAKTSCYQISKKNIIEALGSDYKNVILLSFFKTYFSLNSFFHSIFHETKYNDLYKAFEVKMYTSGEHIWMTGQKNKKIILIIDGNFIHEYTKEYLASRGDIIGDHCLRSDSEISKKYMAFPHCVVLEASIESISQSLYYDIGNKNNLQLLKMVNLMRSFSFFNCFSNKVLLLLVKAMIKKKFKPNEFLKENNELNQKDLFIITKGKARITYLLSNESRDEEALCLIGNDSLIEYSSSETNQYTITAIDNVSCYLLTKECYDQILNHKENYISQQLKDYQLKSIELKDKSIQLKDLYYVKTIKQVNNGQLCLVHNNKCLYLLKAISKKRANKDPSSKYLPIQRKIRLMMNHPFIIETIKTFKTDTFCYFLTESIEGRYLDEVIHQENRKFKANEVRFLMSCLIIITEYLHKKMIAHRRLTPSNLVIDKRGYLKLTDFSNAKIIHDYTWTVIGETLYTAPEIIEGKGYSFSVDYWTIGVFGYYLIYNIFPFQAANPYDLYLKILNNKIEYSDLGKDNLDGEKHLIGFIQCLLQKKINKRLCSINSIRSYPLFSNEGLNLDDLTSFSIDAPFKPGVTPFNLSEILAKISIKYKDYEEGMKVSIFFL